MRFVRTALGWLTLSGEMWDSDEVLDMLEALEEGAVIRVTQDDPDEDDDDT